MEAHSQQHEEISREGLQHLHSAFCKSLQPPARPLARSFTLSLWPICSVDRRKPPAVKGPYLSPGDGDTGDIEQVGCIRLRQCTVVSQREKESSKSLCVHLSVCMPHSLDPELRQQKKKKKKTRMCWTVARDKK